MQKKYFLSILFIALSIVLFALAYIFFGEKSIFFRIAGLIFLSSTIYNLFNFRKNITQSMKRGKQSRIKLIESFSLFVLFIAAISFLNTFDFNFDWTLRQLFNLSKESKIIISEINEPITITLFSYPDGTQAIEGLIEYAQKLGERYEAMNPSMINFVKTDPVRDKAKAEEYAIRQNGTIVFEQGKKREYILPNLLIESFGQGEISYKGETIFSAVLAKLNSNKEVKIYYLTGQGEVNFSESGLGGFDGVKKLLEDRRYILSALDLNHHLRIPDDADIIIVADPKTSFSPQVLNNMIQYINNGGNTLFLVSQNTSEEINVLLNMSGFAFLQNIAVDPARTAKNSGQFAIIPDISPKSEITSLIRNKRKSIIFPSATIITTIPQEMSDPNYFYDINSLAKTSENAFGERSFKEGVFQKDENVDIVGVTCLSASSIVAPQENLENQRRSIIIGSVNFIDNARLYTSGNAEFILNSIDFLLRKDLKTSIAPKIENLSNNMPQPEESRIIFILVTIWIGLLFGISIVTIFTRKNKIKNEIVSRETISESDVLK